MAFSSSGFNSNASIQKVSLESTRMEIPNGEASQALAVEVPASGLGRVIPIDEFFNSQIFKPHIQHLADLCCGGRQNTSTVLGPIDRGGRDFHNHCELFLQ